jgi:DNA-binding MarR family transcriptional regulator
MARQATERTELGIELTMVISRLRARIREEVGTEETGLSLSQLTILHRVRRDGSATAASLAAAEHVSQQAIAQSVAGLKATGLLRSAPDPADGRRSLLTLTAEGSIVAAALIESRDAWLVRAIGSAFDAPERAELARAIELLGRLADADT